MRKLIVFSLIILAVLVTALWWNADRLIQQVARPWLVERIQETLQAEVEIDSLELDRHRLLIRQLALAFKDGLKAQVDEIEIRFSLSSLLQRHLAELVIRHPQLQVTPAQFDAQPAAAESRLPERAPLRIDRWSLEQGTLQLALPDRQLVLHQFQAQGSLDQDFAFTVQALFGHEPGVPFQLDGRGEWRQGLEVTLVKVDWDGQALLPEEVTFRPGALPAAGLNLALVRLDSAAVGALLAAAGEKVPWPEEVSWQIAEPSLSVQWQTGEIGLQISTRSGFVQSGESRWPWQTLELQADERGNQWQITATATLAGESRLQLTGDWQEQAFAGAGRFSSQQPATLAGQFQVPLPAELGGLRQLSLQAGIRATPEVLELTQGQLDLSLPLGELQSPFSARYRGQTLSVAFDRLALAQQDGRSLATAALQLSGDLAAERWQGKWSFSCAEPLTVLDQAGLKVPAEMPRPADLELSGQLNWQNGQLALTGISLQGQLSGNGLSTALAGRAEIQSGPENSFEIKLQSFSLLGVEYSNAAGTVVASGGSLEAAGELRLDPQGLDFKLQGKSSLKEALVGSWYGELSGLPIHFAGQGRWEIASETLQLAAVTLNPADLATIRLHGDLAPDRLQLSGRLEINRMGGGFRKTLQRFGAELLPGIDQLELAGKLAIDAAVAIRAQDWNCNLLLQPEDVTIAWGETLRLTGLRGRFPLQLGRGESLPAEAAVEGVLQWDRLASPLVELSPGMMQMKASANRWELQSPLEASSLGGKLRLSHLLVTVAQLKLQALASVQGMDLELLQLSNLLGWPEMSGRLNATLDDIRVSQERIASGGRASGEAFGGSFQLGNLEIKAPFSRYPTYHADLDFTGLNLHELTKTFEFGEINGVADGYVHGLRLFDGTPSAFEAKFETRPEGTRNISVKAIRNLNTLSQGGLSADLSQGVYQFIDFYRYRKIGLICSLHNDLFHVTGLARPGSDQVLVNGGILPPKIDVIMSSPTISFKEMMQRLKRIERTER